LFDYLKNNNGMVFVNGDDKYIKAMSTGIKNIITYGRANADITGSSTGISSFLEVQITRGADIELIRTQLVGKYNLLNVLAAVTIGRHFNIDDEKIKNALENYVPLNSRSQLIKQGTNTIILDAYNSNPDSMKAAIDNFAQMKGANKILMLGSMMELGKDSEKEHEEIIKIIDGYKWTNVILVGNNFKNIKSNYIYLNTSHQARQWFIEQNFKNSHILIKGSRSMMMEKILEN
jgi:UDP-N-acetylmuramoyl-tripeptide--D-alanyl-D-alanine ligase